MRVKCLPQEQDEMTPARARTWGPFLKRPGNLTGPKSYFEIKVSIFKPSETPIWNGKQNSLTGPVITGSFEKWAQDWPAVQAYFGRASAHFRI